MARPSSWCCTVATSSWCDGERLDPHPARASTPAAPRLRPPPAPPPSARARSGGDPAGRASSRLSPHSAPFSGGFGGGGAGRRRKGKTDAGRRPAWSERPPAADGACGSSQWERAGGGRQVRRLLKLLELKLVDWLLSRFTVHNSAAACSILTAFVSVFTFVFYPPIDFNNVEYIKLYKYIRTPVTVG